MCKRTMYKRARVPMFLWERRACANSGAQAVFPRPRKNGLGTSTNCASCPPRGVVNVIARNNIPSQCSVETIYSVFWMFPSHELGLPTTFSGLYSSMAVESTRTGEKLTAHAHGKSRALV